MSKSESKDIVSLNVEAALNLIPCVGGSLATYFGETRNKKVAERMQKYFTYFSNRLNEIEDRKIDYEYLKSEEFAEFFMQGAEQAARSVTEKKEKIPSNTPYGHKNLQYGRAIKSPLINNRTPVMIIQ